MMSDRRVLIIEDIQGDSHTLENHLIRNGYQTKWVNTGKDALKQLDLFQPGLIFVNASLPDMDGLDFIESVSSIYPEIHLIATSEESHSDTVIQMFTLGVEEYVPRPYSVDQIFELVERLFGSTKSIMAQPLREHAAPVQDVLVGNCPEMIQLLKLIARCAANDSKTVLICGESGTGKQLVAQAIHQGSARKHAPFIELNCAAIPENLLENELFGHERGAYTDARNQEAGVFEQADGGTLFLDEIGDMPLNMQAKILKVVESKKFRRLGGQKDIETQVRIVAATNRDLEKMVRDGEFRADLFFRLSTLHIPVPPLRARKKSIPAMVDYFIKRLSAETGSPVRRIDGDVLSALQHYDWPGNVRELRNVVERAVIHEKSSTITLASLNLKHSTSRVLHAPDMELETLTGIILPPNGVRLEDVEKDLMLQALRKFDGNQARSAAFLGLSLDAFRYRRKKYSIPLRERDH